MKALTKSQGSRKAVWVAGVFALAIAVVIGLSGCSGGSSESSDSSVPDAYKNLDSVVTVEGTTIKDKFLPYFIDILERLKKLDNIDYKNFFFFLLAERLLLSIIRMASLVVIRICCAKNRVTTSRWS